MTVESAAEAQPRQQWLSSVSLDDLRYSICIQLAHDRRHCRLLRASCCRLSLTFQIIIPRPTSGSAAIGFGFPHQISYASDSSSGFTILRSMTPRYRPRSAYAGRVRGRAIPYPCASDLLLVAQLNHLSRTANRPYA
jgi:hypothetical protein